MPNRNGVITRRDIITDEALFFGETYAKELQKAIDKNKELASSAKELNTIAKGFKGVRTNGDYVNNVQKEIEVTQKAGTVWREQIQLENNLISTRRRVELSMEGTNRSLVRERIQLQENNRQLRQQAREQLGLTDAYDRLQRKRNEAQRTLQNLMSAERQNINEVRRAQREYDRLDERLRRVDQASRNFTRSIGNYQSAFAGAGRGLRDLIAAFGVMGGVALFAGIVKNIFAVTKQLNALDTALKAVTQTQSNFVEQQQFLNRIASAYGLEIKSLTKTYTQFYVAAKDKLSGQEIQDIFEKVSKSASLMGLSIEQQEGAFTALQQMLSKGNVQAEEIRGQLGERLPGAFAILAKSMNVTEAELNDLLKQGKVAAKDVLPAFAAELEKTYGADKVDLITTMVAEQNRLTNAWTDFVRELNEGEGVVQKTFVGTLKVITGALQGVNLLMQSEEKRRDNLLSGIEETAYKTEIDRLKELKKTEEDLAKFSAETILSESSKRLKSLREERESLHQNIEVLKEKLEAEDNLAGFDRFSPTTFKINELNERYKQSMEATKVVLGQLRAANEFINPEKKEVANENDSQKEKEKLRLDSLKRLKDAEDDAYELRQFRMQQEIDASKELADDEKNIIDDRLDYLLNASQVEIAKAQDTAEHKLKEFSRYDDAIRDLSDEQIRTLITGGTIREQLFNKEKLYIEQLQAEITDIFKREQAERDKLVEFDVNKFRQGIDGQLLNQNTSLNTDLEGENTRFASLSDAERQREANVEDHERRIYEIKKQYALEALNTQVKAIEDLLAIQDQIPENERVNAEDRAKIENDLSNYKREISELELQDFEEKSDKKVMTAEEVAEKIKELQGNLLDELIGFGNTLFDARIQNIEDEMYQNEEYYQRQLDLAGEDQRQRESIEEESERKRMELERKKRKEQHKQAVYNKAVKTAEIIGETSLAIISALAQVPKFDFGISAAAISALYASIGAVQLANVIATPIPKYSKGRVNGKEEIAWTGDGGRHEVVEHKDGGFYVTDKKPTLTHLLEGDRVYSSIDDFERLKRASIMASLKIQDKKVKDFQATQVFEATYGKELVKEMKQTRKAIEKNKPVVHVNMPKLEIGYEIWKSNNKHWS